MYIKTDSSWRPERDEGRKVYSSFTEMKEVQVLAGMEGCETLAEILGGRKGELCWISSCGDWVWEKELSDAVQQEVYHAERWESREWQCFLY